MVGQAAPANGHNARLWLIRLDLLCLLSALKIEPGLLVRSRRCSVLGRLLRPRMRRFEAGVGTMGKHSHACASGP